MVQGRTPRWKRYPAERETDRTRWLERVASRAMSRSSELVPWLCARLEDLVTRVQLAAPAAIVNVETRIRGDELTSFASGLATPDAESLDLGFTLVRDRDRVRLSADLVVGGSGEVLAKLEPMTGPDQDFDTPALREQILAFIQTQEPRMIERLHGEAHGSEHEAELIERLRSQAEHDHARGDLDEARHAYRMLTMLCCDERDLDSLVRTETQALHQLLDQLTERFPDRRATLDRFRR